jgi:SAM-dependent methyltransferase
MPFVAKRAFGWEPVEITEAWGLRDIRSGMAYPLCNSVQCSACGALFLDIRFTDSEMSSLYSGYRGEAYTALRERFEPGYRERNEIILQGTAHIPKIEAFLSAHVSPPLTILDWGGDTGANTPFRNDRNTLHIYDISNLPVVEGVTKVELATIEGTTYDLIVLSHVLEHLPSPARALSEIAAVMSRETVLYIEVPHEDLLRLNHGSKIAHTKKKYWHEHINFFTFDALHALLDRCGMQPIDLQTIETEGGGKPWHVFAVACRLRQPLS